MPQKVECDVLFQDSHFKKLFIKFRKSKKENKNASSKDCIQTNVLKKLEKIKEKKESRNF